MHPLLAHLATLGASISGHHTQAEMDEVDAALGILLPPDFRDYFAGFRQCALTAGPMWEFFPLTACIQRTREYRGRHTAIRVEDDAISTTALFAFCDALIDAPTYFVVADPQDPRYGRIIGSHNDEGWSIGQGLADFLVAFRKDWEVAVLDTVG